MMKTYKLAIFFLLRYVGLYLVLNTLYGFYIEYYYPGTDPVTTVVSDNVAGLLNVFGEPCSTWVRDSSANVALLQNGVTVVEVYEGCNSLNVIFVYVSFLIAFKRTFKITVLFTLGGIFIIYIVNLLRVSFLFGVANYYPEKLYFFHKFFFTVIIYAFVFSLWYIWVKVADKWDEKKPSER